MSETHPTPESDIDCVVCHYGVCIYRLNKRWCAIRKFEREPKAKSQSKAGLTGPRLKSKVIFSFDD